MKRRLPPLPWLRAFEASARHSSFTAAADELGLTPAAISQQIRLLEGHLGATLFDRLPRGVALTDIGQAYAQPVRRAFRDLEQATSGLFAAPARPVLRVRAAISCAALVIAPQLAAFRQAHPDIDIALSTFVWADRFDMQNSDIDIRWGFGDWPEPWSLHLGHETAIVVCHPDSVARGETFDAVAAGTVYTITGIEQDWPRLAEYCGLTLPTPARRIRVDSPLIALQALTAGPGAAIVLESFARPFLSRGALVAPFAHRMPIAGSHFVVHRKGVEDRPDVQAFTRWIAGLYASFYTDTGDALKASGAASTGLR